MKYIPHKYQEYAANLILDKPICGIFLGLGMGKTIITLTAIDELLHDRFETNKVLVIAPLRVAEDTWGRECIKWDHLKHLKISKVLGPEKNRIAALKSNADIYVINRENVEWLVEHYKTKWPFDMVVIDELSSFKSASAKRFKALRKVRPLIKRIVGLTGTPAPNGLIDLWPQIYLLDRGERLGKTLGGYRDRYFEPDTKNYQTGVVYTYKLKLESEAAIYQKISDICVSMKAQDYLQMPERIDNFVHVEMSLKEKALYEQLERDMLIPFAEGDIDAVNAAALSNKLLQMANGAVYDEFGEVRKIHHRKLDALETLWEAANGKPILVFYAYKHDKARLSELFKGKAKELNTSQDITDWNAGKLEVVLAHPASTGHGLNLQAGGSIIIWFGLTWSLELYLQANGRLYRQGQKETVVIHHIVTAGTIDEDVIKALSRKEVGQMTLIDAVKARMGGQQ
ncbi:SWI/SNF chromatin-remodeling complex subunit snf22 SWI/SNF complex subunit snf22 ATP-dependent helicase snf22 [Candidatus Desulfosporosinus infrequens]|uniref:SWI/SNF chromatin-remodeling complex subunit snf22 SWI/SNF complex subunit snf22 ATP-dependent helicase snf22 n=1 Tax=Candidatus Desulfosporosinus infrequens TaxID=2043169 RepID=A0A2U3KMD2_9FIRM|nr:SWI/SNF chromatin-remodeling complex subunit snf22 SWI/SNF complex subunit snf22 ATP-dependent helicase snf22 [Candidatus Desulfosporosinus infrequens]